MIDAVYILYESGITVLSYVTNKHIKIINDDLLTGLFKAIYITILQHFSDEIDYIVLQSKLRIIYRKIDINGNYFNIIIITKLTKINVSDITGRVLKLKTYLQENDRYKSLLRNIQISEDNEIYKKVVELF